MTEGYAILQPRVGAAGEHRRGRGTRGCSAASPASTRTPAPCPTSTRTCSARARSSARASTTSMPASARSVAGFPDNRILSHDLLEGGYARVGPRQRRAARRGISRRATRPTSAGAIAGFAATGRSCAWLLRAGPGAQAAGVANPISRAVAVEDPRQPASQLVPLAFVALLLLGWICGAAWFATIAVLALALVPGVVAALGGLARRPADLPRGQHVREPSLASRSSSRAMASRSPACRTMRCSRSTRSRAHACACIVTRRKLLEWRTASDVQRAARSELRAASLAAMWIGPALAVVAAVLSQRSGPALRPRPSSRCGRSPRAWSWWVSRPIASAGPRLADSGSRVPAPRRATTWRFFETYVDRSRQLPAARQRAGGSSSGHRASHVADQHRAVARSPTSRPTTSATSRPATMIARTTRTLATMRSHAAPSRSSLQLVRHDDARAAAPDVHLDGGQRQSRRPPVDARSRPRRARRPTDRARCYSGLGATLGVACRARGDAGPRSMREVALVRGELATPRTNNRGAHAMLGRTASHARELVRVVVARGDSAAEAAWWATAFESQLQASWSTSSYSSRRGSSCRRARMPRFARCSTGRSRWRQTARLELTVAATVICARRRSARRERAVERISELRALALRCRELARSRLRAALRSSASPARDRLQRQRSPTRRELLRSARVRGAPGQLRRDRAGQAAAGALVPPRPPAHDRRRRPALLSWSGSMFEYLMPLLVMPTYDGTLLDETYRAAVDRQIAYGREQRRAVGHVRVRLQQDRRRTSTISIARSACRASASSAGSPRISSIAPYASALALMVAPDAACANLRTLADAPASSVRTASTRRSTTRPRACRRARSAHGALVHGAPPGHEAARDRVRAARPADAAALRRRSELSRDRAAAAGARAAGARGLSASRRGASSVRAAARGRARGCACSRRRTRRRPRCSCCRTAATTSMITQRRRRLQPLARPRGHALARRRDARLLGQLLLPARRRRAARFWSIAHQPTLSPAHQLRGDLLAGPRRVPARRSTTSRRTSRSASRPRTTSSCAGSRLTNRGRTRAHDRAHELRRGRARAAGRRCRASARSRNLFVQTEIVRAHQAILCTRRPRSGGEQPPWMMHLMTVHGTARRRCVVRDRSRCDSSVAAARSSIRIAMHAPSALRQRGSVLDPVVAIRNARRCSQPDETVRIHIVTGIAETRDGALGAGREVSRPPRRRSRVRAVVDPQPGRAAADRGHRTPTRSCSSASASKVLYANPALRAPRQLAREQPARTVRAVGLRHLGRPADRAGADRRCRSHRSRASARARRTRTGA